MVPVAVRELKPSTTAESVRMFKVVQGVLIPAQPPKPSLPPSHSKQWMGRVLVWTLTFSP